MSNDFEQAFRKIVLENRRPKPERNFRVQAEQESYGRNNKLKPDDLKESRRDDET